MLLSALMLLKEGERNMFSMAFLPLHGFEPQAWER
jgi:hypothetical protein